MALSPESCGKPEAIWTYSGDVTSRLRLSIVLKLAGLNRTEQTHKKQNISAGARFDRDAKSAELAWVWGRDVPSPHCAWRRIWEGRIFYIFVLK